MNDRRHSTETKTSTSKKTKKNPLFRSLTNISKSLSGIIQNKNKKNENGSKKLEKKLKKKVNLDDELKSNYELSSSTESINETCSVQCSKEGDEIDSAGEVECGCHEHKGKELLNRVFNLDVDTLANCLHKNESFLKKYWKLCKYYDIKCSDWEPVDSVESRKLECSIDLGAVGKPRNYEEQKIILKEPKKRFIIHSCSYSTGIMYSDYFTVNSRFCITKCSAKTSRLVVMLSLEFKKQPNFVIKSFIEKNVFSRSKEYFCFYEKLLEEEQASSSKKSLDISCQETNKSESIKYIQDRIQEVVRVEPINASLSYETKESNMTMAKCADKVVNIFNWSIKLDTYIKVLVLASILIMLLNNRIYVGLNNNEDLINKILKSKSVDAEFQERSFKSSLFSDNGHLDKFKNIINKDSAGSINNVSNEIEIDFLQVRVV